MDILGDTQKIPIHVPELCVPRLLAVVEAGRPVEAWWSLQWLRPLFCLEHQKHPLQKCTSYQVSTRLREVNIHLWQVSD